VCLRKAHTCAQIAFSAGQPASVREHIASIHVHTALSGNISRSTQERKRPGVVGKGFFGPSGTAQDESTLRDEDASVFAAQDQRGLIAFEQRRVDAAKVSEHGGVCHFCLGQRAAQSVALAQAHRIEQDASRLVRAFERAQGKAERSHRHDGSGRVVGGRKRDHFESRSARSVRRDLAKGIRGHSPRLQIADAR
jgi:hypothetical protein